MTTGLENFPPIARSFGLKVAAGAWISTNLVQNGQEVSNLIAAANAGNVDIAVVGSEVLLNDYVSESQLIAYMQQVRQAIPTNIPVTTADTYTELLAHPNVISASNIVFANIYPYWEGRAIDNAVCDLVADYNQLVSVSGAKKVMISETGWPNAGNAVGAAVPSPANAAQFLFQFVTWARTNNVPFFYFEAFNEEWKAKYEGPQGAYWGIWDEYGVLKPWMEPVFDGQTEPTNCSAIPCGSGPPTVSLTYLPPYGDSQDFLEGQECHVSTTSYEVAVYIQTGGGWWTKPYFATPVTPLQPDGSWSCNINTGGNDKDATAVAAFLIPSGYSPPLLSGQDNLPNILYSNSVANVEITRSASQSISGQITVGGLPVSGVNVSLSGAGEGMTQTAPDGKYSFPDLSSSGPYTVTPSSAQFSYSPPSLAFENIVGNQAANFSADSPPLHFIPITPCRVADTRTADGPFGGPSLAGQSGRYFVIPDGTCDVPSTAAAYSLNVTVVPYGSLGYLTVWPSGEAQPLVSTLNSLDGRIKANAAIVPAGGSGAISVFATDTTDLVLDIDGYFVPNTSALEFYQVTPCRLVDTRKPVGQLSGPSMTANQARDFPLLSGSCNIPSTAQAYSLNFTVVPTSVLGYLTTWPVGQAMPLVSTLNDLTGTIVGNAAIVPAGTGGDINVFVTNPTDVVIDINGYFAPTSTGGLSLYPVAPCRVLDTRETTGAFTGTLAPPVDVVNSPCGIPNAAKGFVFNATVMPQGGLGYLTLWPDAETQPVVSTLNALDGAITSNMAIVPTLNGFIDAFASGTTQLVLDISSYFAP